MAEDRQPPTVVEGATTGVDVDDEVPAAAKSAEDRKAADALSKLDARGDDDGAAPAREVDQEAVSRAMNQLGGDKKVEEEKKDVKKIKVDPADVALLVSSACPAVRLEKGGNGRDSGLLPNFTDKRS